VVTATTCAQGVDWLHSLSGVTLPVGGSHPLMSTHNHLSALSDDQFLEVIAIDPNAAAPDTERWFLLDNPAQQHRLESSPELTTWVVATSNLEAALAAVRETGLESGSPVALTRGDLHWKLALMDDKSLCCDGVFPILIEWPPEMNPVQAMQDQGMRLGAVTLAHPQHARLNRAFDALGLSTLVNVTDGPSRISATMSAGSRLFELNSLTRSS